MNRIIKQIRDIEVIEKELNSSGAGVLAVQCEDEELLQIATTFLYRDKNLYIFFEDDELFNSIIFNSNVSFTILKEEKLRDNKKAGYQPTYKYFSISISGVIKKIEDSKIVEDLKRSYVKKYSKKKDGTKLDFTVNNKLTMIDSEEIKAIEETGG
jgi:nitroimidazol reductase NimA-like FMN-containing flavoprotein (pyridoxamine 5'-phosphate oxidase superfamily)